MGTESKLGTVTGVDAETLKYEVTITLGSGKKKVLKKKGNELSWGFPNGSRVEIHGLKTGYLNKKVGEIKDFDAEKGRYKVVVGRDEILIRGINLKPAVEGARGHQ